MHFCFLMQQLEHYSPVSGGAIATVTANVAHELQSSRHRVDIIAPECFEPLYAEGRVHTIRTGSTGAVAEIAAHLEARLRNWDSPNAGRFYAAGLKVLEQLQPDVVVLANDLERITAVRRLLPNVRIVVWIHNECRLRKATPNVLRDADVFLCCSDYIKNWLVREYGLEVARVHTAHAGINRNLFYPSNEVALRNEVRVLFVGRLDPNKGVDIAVDVVTRLRRKGVPIVLSVAGNVWFYRQKGANRDPFQNRLRSAMSEGGVDWMGHVPRRFLPGVMRRHDVALVLSRSEEPFGLVVLESMASGMAVLASPRGGLSEACGGAAMIVDPENTEGIERRLEELSFSRTELNKWKGRSIERVKNASWSDTAEVLCRGVGAQTMEVQECISLE
jgi:glycosyltransferase involved in cell wall biosynthesis